MNERATIFGEVAEAYDRFRPGYPESIVDLVAAHAEGPVTRALEVGAGTGKATLIFAAQGIEVIAVEPDPRMSTVLAARVGALPIRILDSTFEALETEDIGPVDLLFAAAAFHWTDADTRWEQTAAVLRSGGVAAFFGASCDLADEALSQQVDAITEQAVGIDTFDLGAIADADSDSWPASDLRHRAEFADVVETVIPNGKRRPANDFVAHLATVSRYRVLSAPDRDAVLSQIRAVLPDNVDVNEDVTIHLARRV